MDECKTLDGGRVQVAAEAEGRPPGRAVQIDPIKSTLKAPGIKLLKLKYGKPLKKSAFKFNLRRYSPDFEFFSHHG